MFICHKEIRPKLPPTRKYAYLSRPLYKDKSGAPNLQASTIVNFINLTMNRLLVDRPLHNFRNHTKCEVRNIHKPHAGQYKMRNTL